MKTFSHIYCHVDVGSGLFPHRALTDVYMDPKEERVRTLNGLRTNLKRHTDIACDRLSNMNAAMNGSLAASKAPTRAMTHCVLSLDICSRGSLKKNMVLLKNKVIDFSFWMNAYAIKLSPYLFFFHAGTRLVSGVVGGYRSGLGDTLLCFFSPAFSGGHLCALSEQHCQERWRPSRDLITADTLVGSSCEQTTLLLLLLLPLYQKPQSHSAIWKVPHCLQMQQCGKGKISALSQV